MHQHAKLQLSCLASSRGQETAPRQIRVKYCGAAEAGWLRCDVATAARWLRQTETHLHGFALAGYPAVRITGDDTTRATARSDEISDVGSGRILLGRGCLIAGLGGHQRRPHHNKHAARNYRTPSARRTTAAEGELLTFTAAAVVHLQLALPPRTATQWWHSPSRRNPYGGVLPAELFAASTARPTATLPSTERQTEGGD